MDHKTPIDAIALRFYPDKVLREPAAQIPEMDDRIRDIGLRMIEVMREEHGIGLAAPQVGLSLRMFVCDVPADPDDEGSTPDVVLGTEGPVVFINPELTDQVRTVEPYEEGCLSLPDIRGDVMRPPELTVSATDLNGEKFSWRVGGLLARCIQHENDHLDGVLIIDKFTAMSRLKTRSAVRSLERAGGH